MLGGLKKALSKRKSTSSTGSMGGAVARATHSSSVSFKSAELSAGGLAPPLTDNQVASPPTRRPNHPGVGSIFDQPPAYSPGPATQPASASIATDTDPYAFLKSFDTVFLIDDSGSMAGRSWRETAAALEMITPICTERDADGVDLYFLNHPDSAMYRNIVSPGTVVEIFQTVQPHGATPTGQRLHQILKPYLQRYEKHPETTKPMNVIVITDGEPSDDVESPIIQAAKKLDKLDAPAWQVGIQFFQVGKEPGAREHLQQLDDGLKELAGDDELRDIVDTVPFTGEDSTMLTGTGILKVVLGSVHKRLDRNSKNLHGPRPMA